LKLTSIAPIVLIALIAIAPAWGEDWPQWRYDAGRTASSPEALPDTLELQWVRQYTPRETLWDDPLNQDLMQFDEIFEPIVLGDTLYMGFNDSDKVVAIDVETGEERWTHYVDGPVRLPVSGWKDCLFFTSDDGGLYCLNRHTGERLWRFQGAPTERMLLGNKRLISAWPARGGVVVADDTVYFGASIWPFMGTFLYALDAATGELRWMNDGNGAEWLVQPHGAPSFAGVGPQGAFVVDGDFLLTPGGRSVPAAFDRASGAFLHYTHNQNNKTGGAFVAALDGVFFNHHRESMVNLYQSADGKNLARQLGRYPVMTSEAYYFSGETVFSVDAGAFRGAANPAFKPWKLEEVNATGDLIQAGNRLYAAGDGQLTAISLAGDRPEIVWTKGVQHEIKRLIAANGRLFVVCQDGLLMAFGAGETTPKQWMNMSALSGVTDTAAAEALLDFGGVENGYALSYGIADGDLLEGLVTHSDLQVVAMHARDSVVRALRERFDRVGLYGKRFAALKKDFGALETSPYLAALTLVQADVPIDADQLANLFHAMRPYGGVAVILGLDEAGIESLSVLVKEAAFPGLEMESDAGRVRLRRVGALPGSAPWTHYMGDVAQTGKSDDQRVKLPLGLLWFGGSSNLDVLPRHGHGPPEQVAGGRLVIQGMNLFSARDVYTGRVLWRREMYDMNTFGVYYNETYKDTPTKTLYNQVHIPGANMRGGNYVLTEDEVYVAQKRDLYVLDAATGKDLRSFRFPPLNPGERRLKYPDWGYVGVYENVLIGGAGFVPFTDLVSLAKAESKGWEWFDVTASKRLVGMDRKSGEVKWDIPSNHGFLHNATVAGGGLIYSLDKLPPHVASHLKRRGKLPEAPMRLLAIDVQSGEIKWKYEDNIFGSYLSYSEENDILLQSTRPARDTIDGEDGERMIAYRAQTGEILWDLELDYRTFPLLHGTTIITEGRMFDLLTGEVIHRSNPLTGEEEPWSWKRYYGCNFPIAGEHLLTFRTGAAGFYDFSGGSGTGMFGGFKSSCTSNLVIADGVLNAPDYTRTCSCSYQNQTSLAFFHDPQSESWTFNDMKRGEAPIRQLGVNLGAPGDRQSDEGTLWLEYPYTGGPTPEVPVKAKPEKPGLFRHHTTRASGEMAWVAASGAEGMERLRIELAPGAKEERRYTVRLIFAEWAGHGIGDRVFDVSLQGAPVLENFDIRKETDAQASLIKEFKGVMVRGSLVVGLQARTETPTLLCGVEIVAEGW
jgi:outer membrane protein assembly factor BamB